MRNPVDFLRSLQGVNAMEEFKKRKGLPDLVFLKVANEVPAAPGGEAWNFRFCFLNPALAKKQKPVIYRFKQGLRRVRFGHCDNLRGLGRRPGSLLHGGL